VASIGAMREDGFTLETTGRDGLTLVALRGELDLSSSPRLAETLEALAGEDRRVVLDLRDLQFMDSTGLAVILRYHQRAKDARFDLVVVRGPEPVDRVFRVTQTDTLLELLDVPPAA
jgi:anti-sigma B factor antagonist